MMNEDKNKFKITGMSENGNVLLYTPPTSDIVYFCESTKVITFQTDNIHKIADIAKNDPRSPFHHFKLDDFKKSLLGYFGVTGSGYYLLSHNIQKMTFLGVRSEWNQIAKSLDGVRSRLD